MVLIVVYGGILVDYGGGVRFVVVACGWFWCVLLCGLLLFDGGFGAGASVYDWCFAVGFCLSLVCFRVV